MRSSPATSSDAMAETGVEPRSTGHNGGGAEWNRTIDLVLIRDAL